MTCNFVFFVGRMDHTYALPVPSVVEDSTNEDMSQDSNAQEEMQRLASSAHLALKNGLDSSLQMLEQILEIQKKEYGSQDRRNDITIEKINMLRRRGSEFAATIEELQKTLALPDTNKEAST